MKTLDIVATGVSAALYAGFGYMTHLGVFAPVIGVVRFWPSVIIPAVFAILFGPLVGGLGAAIGIFISDMLIHGNALLSLTVGVTSNFVGFYLVGYVGRKRISTQVLLASTVLGFLVGVSSLWLYSQGYLDLTTTALFSGICIFSSLLTIVISVIWPNRRSYGVACVLGLMVGSAMIGLGVWGFSQIFMLPSGEANLPFYASILWFVWTYASEIPFLVILVPPILKACYAAFPRFKPAWEERET